MREKVVYTCEFCHEDYETKEEAERCETSHRTDLKVTEALHEPYYKHNLMNNGFPPFIRVESGGTEMMYKIKRLGGAD